MEPHMMLLRCIAVTFFAVYGLPTGAQTTSPSTGAQNQSVQDNAPGTGGTSRPGVPGLPGSKSGPAVRSQGSDPSSGDSTTTHQDPSGVRGLPGSKAGPAVNPPAKRE